MSSWVGDGDEDDGEDAAAAFETVGRRSQILQALSSEPLAKAELVRTLSVSRSTVDRGVERLVDLGLVERSDGGFVATTAGRVALETHDEAIRAMANVLGAGPVLDRLPESVNPPPSLFRDAVVCTGDLTAMEQRTSLDFDLGEVTTLTGFNGPFLFSLWPEGSEQLARLGDSATLVLSAESLDWLSNRYPDGLDAMVDAGVRVCAVDDDPAFGVVVMNRPTTASVTLVVYDHMGGPEALVVSYDPSAVAWGRTLVAARAETARPYRVDD
ncbi:MULTISPECIES: helix-turn-helix transcriptional regulator [Haloferax]|uniref:MarR family protein n=1 Tax=Haloferax massiliensis TaxID=1476858 RepID=A0A0D6JNL1_9EURY|nr:MULTISPECIES: MarR family transcriptional regulator [Haloferax]MDS0241101.1 MarR family transcriptional regulator [Haloferax sp. S2CR25]MDS0444222.1 MarR family transcriptional regulator [Haloferax sp. S2CR25-2]CQR49486.1 MarR family protein [Haloferax massiliensis]